MEEKVILEIDFKSATAQAAELQKTVDALTLSMTQLDRATPEYQELNAELKAVRAEQGQLITTATKLLEVQQTQDGSLKQLRAQLRQQEIAYSNLSRAERENGVEGTRLKASINAIRTELKKAEGGIGDFRRNVGDYKNAVREAGQELIAQSPILSQLASNFKSVTTIVKGANLGFTAATGGATRLGVAIRIGLLGPISLVIAAFTGIVAYFTRTKEGSDKLAQGVAFLGGLFDGLVKILAEFGKVIVDAFSNPQKFLDLLVENFVNRFKAIGDAAFALGDVLKGVFTLDSKLAQKGLQDFAKAQLQLVTGLSKANQDAIAKTLLESGKAAMEAEKRTQAVEARIRALGKVNAELKNQVEKNDKLSDNAGISFAKRQAAATKAIQLQKQLNANNVAILQEQLAIAKIKQGVEGETTANLEEIAALEKDIIEKVQEGNTKIYDLQNKQAQIRISEITARLNGEKAALEGQLILVKGNADEELRIKKELVDKNAEIAKQAAGLSANEIQEITIKANAEKDQLDKDYLIKRVKDANEATNQIITDQLNAVKKGSVEEVQLLDKQADILRTQQLALAELEIEDATELANKKAAIESQYQKTKIDLTKQGLDAIKKLEDQKFANEIETLKLKTSNEQLDQEQRIQAQRDINEQEKQRRIDNALTSGESVANIQEEFRQKDVELTKQSDEAKFAETQQISEATFGFLTNLNDLQYQADLAAAGNNAEEKEKIEKAYAARQKRLKLFEILLNQSVAIAKTLAETPFPVSIGASIAIGAQIAALAGQVVALQFNKGGYVPGNGDTDTVPAMLTPGEVVINKRAARANMGLLDSINRSTGGAALIPQRLNSGGIVLPVSGGSQGLSANDVTQIVQSMPSPIVDVRQIVRGINNQVTVTQSATF
jgi:hypothetical protein